ncbi:(d)CMP kinase [Flavobacteriaceae bacterium MHTCC 0001]
MSKITIAIDGLSSTGKSTVAKQIAKELGYIYVDSGAMYRAVTLYAIRKDLIRKNYFNKVALMSQLPEIEISFSYNDQLGYAEILLNNENIEGAIRTLKVSSFVSQIAAISEVRQKLVAIQKKLGGNKGVVMDGRDIGTVVFPDAELKIFMTASADKRASRRYKELLDRGDNISYDAVLKNVTERDHLDATRKDSPLIKADDAIEIDNSQLSLDDQYAQILNLAKIAISNKE